MDGVNGRLRIFLLHETLIKRWFCEINLMTLFCIRETLVTSDAGSSNDFSLRTEQQLSFNSKLNALF